MSVMAYYTKLKGMWDELSSYSKIPTCTCGAAQEFIKEREEEKLHQFLMGLDDAVFRTVRSQILSMEPLPSLSRAYATITREERHRSIARGQEERVEGVALATQVAAKGKNVVQNKQQYAEKYCSNCKKLGHEVSECFELISYPSWFNRKGGRGRRKIEGGRDRDQQNWNTRRSQVTAAHVHQPSRSTASHAANQKSIPGLSNDQFQRLLTFLDRRDDSFEKLSGPYLEEPDWSG
ncbi:uncharacterized protein LOC109850963 [Asparagus officinalis]|uniref:uncharacterized protein LOC109850963 n=1 Tax=Asparagus officinalis TaxID=4686 RepID=UPI00098E1485|nr:uncharacterized protein LOC109850963 [Asparagus officinalis]